MLSIPLRTYVQYSSGSRSILQYHFQVHGLLHNQLGLEARRLLYQPSPQTSCLSWSHLMSTPLPWVMWSSDLRSFHSSCHQQCHHDTCVSWVHALLRVLQRNTISFTYRATVRRVVSLFVCVSLYALVLYYTGYLVRIQYTYTVLHVPRAGYFQPVIYTNICAHNLASQHSILCGKAKVVAGNEDKAFEGHAWLTRVTTVNTNQEATNSSTNSTPTHACTLQLNA